MGIGRPLVSPAAEAYLDVALPRLMAIALSLTGHRQDAEDLVQDSVAKLLVSWSKVERASAPDAYVRQLMVNTFLSRRRRRSSSEVVSHDVVTADRVTGGPSVESGVADRDHVRRLLLALPPRERAVMVLRHLEDLPDAAIAEVLKCSAVSVRVTAHRARERLRATMEGTLVPCPEPTVAAATTSPSRSVVSVPD
ncbi:sigma-70 family RNA polymerase sigma factor [Knoellia subterranea]|uniref:RNA polymerase subunit sigma-24 n=1 Tax=Knoellia subterranea KCTC 19937 TaxID=1385521 RepID=A0A0A0JQ54_9MICO|nr:sigma-70 family RNA polymerase sigma factor [Knoellia subterranea]KGN39303.1 RNA polymerase subunit sigma-24 [Knoellia subterranea KCTC 19937]